MSTKRPSDLQQLISARMASGRYESEEALIREALRALDESDRDLEAVAEAIQELRAGDRGLLVHEAFAAIRQSVRGSSGSGPTPFGCPDCHGWISRKRGNMRGDMLPTARIDG